MLRFHIDEMVYPLIILKNKPLSRALLRHADALRETNGCLIVEIDMCLDPLKISVVKGDAHR